MFKEARAWIASQLDQSALTAQETPTDQPSGEQYATALKQFIDVNPRFELGQDVWKVNTSLTYQMLWVTFVNGRESHNSIKATKEDGREQIFDSRFKGYVRAVSDLVRPAVSDLLQALSATRSDRKAAAIIWTQMTEGLTRPVTDHLVTVWIMWAINGTTEKKFKALADQYKYFCHHTSPCAPPKAIPVAGPRWMPDLDLEFKRVTMEGEIQAAVIEALKQATGLKHHEIEALRPATAAHTAAAVHARTDAAYRTAMQKLSDPIKFPGMSLAEAMAALGRKKSWVYDEVRKLRTGMFSTVHVKQLREENPD